MARKVIELGLSKLQQAFVEAFDGDTKLTAERLAMDARTASSWASQAWFIEALQRRTEREAAQVRRNRIAFLADQILQREQIQAFWSSVVCDDEEKTADRLKASELLMRSQGGLDQVMVLKGDAENPIAVKKIDLEERIKLLAVSGAQMIEAKAAE